MKRAALLLALLAGAAAAQKPPKPDPCRPQPQLYISPMGEAFRAPMGAGDPMATWFAAADRDGDRRVTLDEFRADAMRAFDRFDLDRNGEIEPAELIAYETDVAPEIRLWQRRPFSVEAPRGRKGAEFAGAQGAGQWAQLNIPHPVASADLDLNRGVTGDEWRTVADRRFLLLGPTNGVLTLTALKPTPAQVQLQLCAVKAAKRR